MLKVYLTDLTAYNNGFLVGQWITLPCDFLHQAISEVLTEGEHICSKNLKFFEHHEELFITDYEWESVDLENIEPFVVGEYDNIYDLNDKAALLVDLEERDLKIVSHLMRNNGYAFEEAITKKEEVIFYEKMSLEDVAYEFAEEGLFGDISPTLFNYVDFKALGEALLYDGYYEEYEGVFYYV